MWFLDRARVKVDKLRGLAMEVQMMTSGHGNFVPQCLGEALSASLASSDLMKSTQFDLGV